MIEIILGASNVSSEFRQVEVRVTVQPVDLMPQKQYNNGHTYPGGTKNTRSCCEHLNLTGKFCIYQRICVLFTLN